MGVGPGVTAWNVTFTLTLAFTFEMVNVPPDFGTSSKPLADATSKPLSGVMVMVTLSPSVTDEALAEILPPPFALTVGERLLLGPLAQR